jgi:hypothetical protein
VRVHVRALLGSMPELGLNCLDRVTVGDGLARDRMPTKRVMTQRSELSFLKTLSAARCWPRCSRRWRSRQSSDSHGHCRQLGMWGSSAASARWAKVTPPLDAEHEQLTVNTRCFPSRVLAGDSPDERSDLRIDDWSIGVG